MHKYSSKSCGIRFSVHETANLPNRNTCFADKLSSTTRTEQTNVQVVKVLSKVNKTSLVINGEDSCKVMLTTSTFHVGHCQWKLLRTNLLRHFKREREKLLILQFVDSNRLHFQKIVTADVMMQLLAGDRDCRFIHEQLVVFEKGVYVVTCNF